MTTVIKFIEANENQIIAHSAGCHDTEQPLQPGCNKEDNTCDCKNQYHNAYDAMTHFNRGNLPEWDEWQDITFADCTGWEAPTLTTYRSPECQWCSLVSTFYIPVEAGKALTDGTPIQDVFPNMSPRYREHIRQGTHPSCWDENLGFML